MLRCYPNRFNFCEKQPICYNVCSTCPNRVTYQSNSCAILSNNIYVSLNNANFSVPSDPANMIFDTINDQNQWTYSNAIF